MNEKQKRVSKIDSLRMEIAKELGVFNKKHQNKENQNGKSNNIKNK